jgi:hypothetical protein
MNTIQMLMKSGDIKDYQKEMTAAQSANEFVRLDGIKQAVSKQMQLTQIVYKDENMDKTEKRQLMDQFYTAITNQARIANQMMDGLDKQLDEVKKAGK